jgi:hypothetical protein
MSVVSTSCRRPGEPIFSNSDGLKHSELRGPTVPLPVRIGQCKADHRQTQELMRLSNLGLHLFAFANDWHRPFP